MPAYAFQPSSYPLHYPPEIAAIIAGYVGEDSMIGLGCYMPDWRNEYLHHLALVSAVWASAALPLLYSDLKLQWRASSGLKLLETLEKRPELLARIRSIEVAYPTHHMLACEIRENGGFFTIEEYKQKWDALSDAERAKVGTGADDYDGWCMDVDHEAAVKAVDGGPDRLWAGNTWRPDDEAIDVGTRAFWHLIAQLPRLQHLAVENIKFLVPGVDKTPLDKVLKGLTSFAIHSSDEYDATPPLAALAAAENIHSLRISNHDLTPFPLPFGKLPFPHLRHLNVISWALGDGALSWTTQGSQLSEACPVLDLALAARETLNSLLIEPSSSWFRTEDPHISLRLVGEALRLLPHVRTLILPPSTTDSPLSITQSSLPQNRNTTGDYPGVLLAALTSSTLEHFEIGDVPTNELLAALPISLTALTFNPRNGPREPWLFEAMLDQLVKVVLKVKSRLPALALVTLNLHEDRGWNRGDVGLSNRDWVVLNEPKHYSDPQEEEIVWREERQLRREKVAADVGVCLRSRPTGRKGYGG